MQATRDPGGSGLVANAWSTPSNAHGYGLSYTYNRYDGAYSSTGVLLDYQGAEAATIDITNSFLSYGFSGTVPLYVTAFPGSLEPFSPDLGDAFRTAQFAIPTGDDPVCPLVLGTALDIDGPVAFLLTTGLSPDYDIYEGVSSYITLSVVSEPSAAVMFPLGTGFALLHVIRRKKKRPDRGARAGIWKWGGLPRSSTTHGP